MDTNLREKLNRKSWYRNSSPEIKGQLHELHGNGYAGFIEHLATFDDVIGDTEVVHLERIAKASYSLIVPIFRVKKGGKVFTYEFVSWKMGPNSGAKGVVFLRDKDKDITSFVLLRATKFALGGAEAYDCVGGFAEGSDLTLSDNVLREISEEVGKLSNIEIFDLGAVYPDHGMTCNHPKIFVAFADVTTAVEGNKNSDEFEVLSTVQIFPIGRLDKLIEANDDGLFLATVLRAKTRGLI